MDAVTSISQRIAQIQTLVAPATAPRTSGVATSALTSTSFATPASTATSGSFAQALAAATGMATGGAAGAVPLTSAAAQLNAEGVPHALAAYGNGRIPEQALAPIQGSSERMWAPAAQRLDALRADARADGVAIGVTDGYRSYESQVSVAQKKGLYSQGGLAAVPGTSQHGWGLAVDLQLDATAQAWMRQHASEYGFVEAVPREPWHWEFHPAG